MTPSLSQRIERVLSKYPITIHFRDTKEAQNAWNRMVADLSEILRVEPPSRKKLWQICEEFGVKFHGEEMVSEFSQLFENVMLAWASAPRPGVTREACDKFLADLIELINSNPDHYESREWIDRMLRLLSGQPPEPEAPWCSHASQFVDRGQLFVVFKYDTFVEPTVIRAERFEIKFCPYCGAPRPEEK